MRLRDEYAAKVQSLTEAEQAVATLTEETADLRIRLIMSVSCPTCLAKPTEVCWFIRPGRPMRGSGGTRWFHGYRVRSAGIDDRGDGRTLLPT